MCKVTQCGNQLCTVVAENKNDNSNQCSLYVVFKRSILTLKISTADRSAHPHSMNTLWYSICIEARRNIGWVEVLLQLDNANVVARFVLGVTLRRFHLYFLSQSGRCRPESSPLRRSTKTQNGQCLNCVYSMTVPVLSWTVSQPIGHVVYKCYFLWLNARENAPKYMWVIRIQYIHTS